MNEKLNLQHTDYIILVDIVLAILLYEVKYNAYFILLISIMALFFQRKGKLIKQTISNRIVIYNLFFVCLGFLSSIWSIGGSYAVKASLTMFLWIIWFVVLCNIYVNRVEEFLHVFSVSIDIVAVYTVFYYGVPSIIRSLLSIERIDNGFNNINTLGLLFSINILIGFYKIMFEKVRHEWVRILFMMLMVFAMSSRKALLVVFLGGGLLICMQLKMESLINRMIKVLIFILFIVLFLYFLRNTSFVQSIWERMEGAIALLSFTGFSMDGSTALRKSFIDVGIQEYKKHLLLGIGLDNSRFLLRTFASRDTYLHNNFVELLCDVGSVGFILYYLPHFFIIKKLYQNRKYWNNYDKLVFSMEISLLVLDYGRVSYYERITWLLMVPIAFSYLKYGTKTKKVIYRVNGLGNNTQQVRI